MATALPSRLGTLSRHTIGRSVPARAEVHVLCQRAVELLFATRLSHHDECTLAPLRLG